MKYLIESVQQFVCVLKLSYEIFARVILTASLWFEAWPQSTCFSYSNNSSVLELDRKIPVQLVVTTYLCLETLPRIPVSMVVTTCLCPEIWLRNASICCSTCLSPIARPWNTYSGCCNNLFVFWNWAVWAILMIFLFCFVFICSTYLCSETWSRNTCLNCVVWVWPSGCHARKEGYLVL